VTRHRTGLSLRADELADLARVARAWDSTPTAVAAWIVRGWLRRLRGRRPDVAWREADLAARLSPGAAELAAGAEPVEVRARGG
jgi:hypothetical protein